MVCSIYNTSAMDERDNLKAESEFTPASASAAPQQLRRELSFVDGICFIISIMIGSGIFASPGVTLDRAGSPGRIWCAYLACLTAGLLSYLCMFACCCLLLPCCL